MKKRTRIKTLFISNENFTSKIQDMMKEYPMNNYDFEITSDSIFDGWLVVVYKR